MSSSIYVHVARAAIQSRLEGSHLDKNVFLSDEPALAHNGACFVTLNLRGRLRGCIGSLIAYRPLIDDLIANSEAAAFRDPRFPPLSSAEFDETDVEVSLLSEPRQIYYRDADDLKAMIRPHIDGVILRSGSHQATFLPQVWDELNDFKRFFAQLGRKAALGDNPLSYHPEVYVYQVRKFAEEG